ncbi:MAG: peptide ABC transporter substrate-binding protein [Chloroflexi bacterium]|nr:peptide ABC transporter substrate-binding protein [Chloroflexota bacterium]
MAKNLRLALALVVVVSVLAVLMAGCTQSSTPTPSGPGKAAPTASPSGATKGEVKPGTDKPAPKAQGSVERITIGLSQEPDTLFQGVSAMAAAAAVANALGTQTVNGGVASLVWRNDKNEAIPGIAESVPTLDNGGAKYVGDGTDRHLEVTFKLRKDVKWHDGTPVTAKDVKFDWEMTMNPDFAVPDRSQAQKIQEVATPDDYTVVFKFMSEKQAREAAKSGGRLKDPKQYADYANQSGPVTDPLYYRYGAVMPQHLYSKIAAKDLVKSEYARKPVGMGAYKMKEWVAGQSITLDANPDFFLGAPKIKTVVFKIVQNTDAIIAQLKTGEIDVVTEAPLQLDNIDVFNAIAAAGAIKFNYVPAMSWEHLEMNAENRFLKDANVRKAIAYAIDRQGIVDKLLFGKTRAINSWILPNSWAYSDGVTRYDYNKDKAKQLLQQAGFKAGADGIMTSGSVPLKLKLITTAGNTLRERTSQIMQQNLKEVGIAVDLEFMPSKNFFAGGGAGPLIGGTYDLALFGGTAGDDPGGLEYHSKNIPSSGNNWQGQNVARWKNSKNDEFLTKANASLSQKERKALYAEQQRVFSDELPILPLYQRVNITATKAELQNFKPTPTNTPVTWNIHEWALPAN